MIGFRIKELRKTLKLSQAAFGKKLGVSRDVISNYENGRVPPREVFLDLLCTIYPVNKDWLLTGAEPMLLDQPGESGEFREHLEILTSLSPKMRGYAVKLLRDLLEMDKDNP